MSKPNLRAKAFHEARFSPAVTHPKANKIINEYFNIKKHPNDLLGNYQWIPIGPFNPDTTKDPVMFGIGRINVVRFDYNDPNTIYAGTASGGLWISRDAGKSFFSPEITNVLSIGISDISIHPSDNNKLLIATGDANAREFQRGYSIGIMISADRGSNWQIIDPFPDIDFYFIKRVLWHPTKDSTFILSTSEGLIISNDLGKTFNILTLQGNQCSDLKFDDNNEDILYITTFDLNGGAGLFEFNFKSGLSNTLVLFPNVVRLEICQSDDKIYLIGARKVKHDLGIFGFYHLVQNRFIQLPIEDVIGAQGHYNLTLYIDKNTDKIYAGGLILHTIGLTDYTEIEAIEVIHKDQHHIEMNPHDSSIWVCNDGGMYRKKPNSHEWEFMSQNMDISQVYRISLHPYNPKILLAGTQDNGTFRLFYDKWSQVLGGDGMESAFSLSNPLNILMTAEAGRIALSNNGAKSISRDYLTFSINERRPWTIDIESYKNNFVIGYINLWEILSYGESFNKLTEFNDDKFITSLIVRGDSIYFAKKNQLYIYSSGITNKLLDLEDELSINSIGFDRQHLIFTVGGYKRGSKVFAYDGNNLSNITYNLINIHVNKIVYDNHTDSYFLASDIGVWKLDNTQNWSPFSIGMPSCIISDLELSSKSGEIYAATYGRGVWKCKINDCSPQKIDLNITKDTTICSNQSLEVYIINPEKDVEYIWHDGIIGITRIAENYGEYHVAELKNNCVTLSNTFQLTQSPLPDISFILLSRNPVCYGDTLKIQAIIRNSENSQLRWSDGTTNDTLITINEGKYYLTATNEFGCIAVSDTIDLQILEPLPPPIIFKTDEGLAYLTDFEPSRAEWMLDDILVATDDKILIPSKSGTYKLILLDRNYCKVWSNELKINYISDINDVSYNIFPNPTNESIDLELYLNDPEYVKIYIYDGLGKSQLVYESDNQIKYLKRNFSLSTILQGFYSFRIIYGKGRINIPFIKFN